MRRQKPLLLRLLARLRAWWYKDFDHKKLRKRGGGWGEYRD